MPTWGGQFGAVNGQWKGGRLVASNGYVLIRVGTNHHLSDVRGYAYEHRVIAEKKLGRRLLPSEQVHHIDGDKKNNDPDNLDVVESIAAHRALHRVSGRVRRLPNEENKDISCACGCGVVFKMFDSSGRPRKFVTGHNSGGRRR